MPTTTLTLPTTRTAEVTAACRRCFGATSSQNPKEIRQNVTSSIHQGRPKETPRGQGNEDSPFKHPTGGQPRTCFLLVPTRRRQRPYMTTVNETNTMLDAQGSSRTGEDVTPTTPRQNARFDHLPPKDVPADISAPTTPTRSTFSNTVGHRPLPEDAATPASVRDGQKDDGKRVRRELSHRSRHSIDMQDVEMGEGEEGEEEDGEDDSDNDSITSDSQRPSKKKKGQRFFCTDFPPCQLSFTRSEHLARHIRYVWQAFCGRRRGQS